MKIIDIYNKVANGEQVPHFVIDEIEYYIGADGFVKDMFGVEVEWAIDKQWLNEEVEIIEVPILTDKEREYLKAVIKPFNVTSIEKCEWNDEVEYISIEVNGEWVIEFPTFKKGTRYKGMELNSYYTVEELDLEED